MPSQSLALPHRIQGFGNHVPPRAEEESGAELVKRAASKLGDLVGEEVILTVEDFREKGPIGAVKDAVADVGDIFIDGVSSLVHWFRGDPFPEEAAVGTAKDEEAANALHNGPDGAAYGVSQVSPTGGINAVWIMPGELDADTLRHLSQYQEESPQSDPNVLYSVGPHEKPSYSAQQAGYIVPPYIPPSERGVVSASPFTRTYVSSPPGQYNRGGFPSPSHSVALFADQISKQASEPKDLLSVDLEDPPAAKEEEASLIQLDDGRDQKNEFTELLFFDEPVEEVQEIPLIDLSLPGRHSLM